MVAMHLLKWVAWEADTKGRDLELRYFRDIDGREVDFVLVEKRQPVLMVECKWQDHPVQTGLKYLKARFPECQAWQISAAGRKDFLSPEGIRVCPAPLFLATLV
jgi:predicted AAA+ superfamily ATPase